MTEPRHRRVAVIGLGLVGTQRLLAFEELRRQGVAIEVVAVHDSQPPRPDLASISDASPVRSIDDVIACGPDLAVVAVPHDSAVVIARRLLEAGTDVLLEKPLGRTANEARSLRETAHSAGRRLFVGLNYRFMEGVGALLRDVSEGAFGALISLEVAFGHGGSPGDEATWKLDPIRAGGGCLIDPGIHVLDLSRLIAGDLRVRSAAAWQGHWATGIEEECHVLLSGSRVPIVNIAVSVVRWRSTFVLRVNGVEGYGVVTGRGRSYGPQTYVRGRRWGWQDAPSQAESEELVCRAEVDESFLHELRALLCATPGTAPGVASADEGVEAMELLDACRLALSPHD